MTAAVTAALILVACTPEASSPEPPDPVEGFRRQMSSESFTGQAELTGTVTVAAIEVPLTGSFDVVGDASRSSTTLSLPDMETTFEEISIGTETYTREDGGAWFLEPPGDGDELLTWLTTLSTLEQVGTEDIGGVRLYRLEPSEPPDPAVFGVAEWDLHDASASMSFLVEADGTMRQMSGTLEGTGPQGPVSFEFDFAFTEGAPAAIEPPSDVWLLFSSKRFAYRIGHPDGWDVRERRQFDVLLAPDAASTVVVARTRVPRGLAEGAALAAFLRGSERQLGSEAEDVETVTVDGATARLATFHYRTKQGAFYSLYLVAVRRHVVYEVFLTSFEGSEATDRTLFHQMMLSFTPGEAA